MAWLYTVAAMALLPGSCIWPSRCQSELDLHYRAAWVGFDCLLAFAIIRTAYMAFRVDQRVQFPAIATATLLIVDAWFDVTTASRPSQFFEALLLAALFEVPAAGFSLYLARQVNRRIGTWPWHRAPKMDRRPRPTAESRGPPGRPTGRGPLRPVLRRVRPWSRRCGP